ncbi:hypothetical protein NOJ05_13125 [Neorhizobium galegae]|uniref:hypothetical protein n=1 Tax=Neorhizobium galegae TaxID=399 RepID=UPI0006225C2D|nr:hypothetical protein [Neorhizobium galegae]MCQ1772589.1 hypothetical protein [Neorhizobium galegae]MCQ1778145.1 hypothetical protein [Neorhizobium galegae]MCQ1796886.1 hypothetical protein [Neorhizobium galegae]CDZ28137.1 Hypothetical protein NGAL_HAMBI490_29950 [Neorhizobium galegae bv. officinalis]
MTRYLALILLLLPSAALPQDAHSGHQSPYVGQEERAVTSLSADDILELERGGGWGLAKPAELNGVPGPRHVLDLARDLSLTEIQLTRIEDLFERMKREAVAEGGRYLEAERAVDALFRRPDVNPGDLAKALSDAEQSRGRLRYIHLSVHIETMGILTPDQVRGYAVLRGYRKT